MLFVLSGKYYRGIKGNVKQPLHFQIVKRLRGQRCGGGVLGLVGRSRNRINVGFALGFQYYGKDEDHDWAELTIFVGLINIVLKYW